MKNILLVTTQYRVGERIYPIIPELAKDYNLDLMKLYQMDPDWKWPGDVDLRDNFEEKYHIYFDNIHVRFPKDLDYSKYDLIITDDNRPYNGLAELYSNRQCPVLACSHGVTEHNYHITGKNRSFDGCFVFGEGEVSTEYHIPAGIPANDELKTLLSCEKKHILVIVSYLGYEGVKLTGNVDTPYFINFDKHLLDSLNLLEIQQKYKKPIIFKLKSRPESSLDFDKKYLRTCLPEELDFHVILDVDNDNKLIAESEVVITAPSTLALKPIQLQIPTVMLRGTGQTGIFKNYNNLLSPIEGSRYNTDEVINGLEITPTLDTVNSLIHKGAEFSNIKTFKKGIDYVCKSNS